MKKIYILFFLNCFIFCHSQAIKKEKTTRAAMVYSYFTGVEKAIETINIIHPELKNETDKINLLKTTNFGRSKKNAEKYLNSIGDWKQILSKDIDSALTEVKNNILLSSKEEIIKYLQNTENSMKGKIPSPLLEFVLAFEYENQNYKEFSNGYTYTFSTKGHNKSKNTELIITIPKSWLAQEGKQPNIIQNFTDDCGSGFNTINIMTQELPIQDEIKDLTFEEIDNEFWKEIFTEEWVKDLGNDNEKFISFKPMRIANRSGCLAIYESIIERLDMKIKIRRFAFIFHDLNYLHFVNCSLSTNKISESLEELSKESLPFYYMVINSLIIPPKSNDIINLSGNSFEKSIFIEIGGSSYKFLLDTGASISSMNENIFNELYKNGILTKNNFLKKDIVELANGELISVDFWVVPKLKIGSKVLNDIVFVVQKNNSSTPLLGMNILSKLDIWKIDLENNKIYLK